MVSGVTDDEDCQQIGDSVEVKMCGIFAAATRKGIAAERITAALKALQHRGPDGAAPGYPPIDDGRWVTRGCRSSA